MNWMNKKEGYILLIVVNLFFSCSKDKMTMIDNTWIVKSIQVNADSVLYVGNDDLLLSFENRRHFKFRLDPNSMTGKCNFKSNNRIEFKGGVITEICCDSDASELCISILNDELNYTLTDNELELSNSNSQNIRFVNY